MGLGMGEILVIFLIVLLMFGAKRLPEIARAMGQASNEFKKAKNEVITTVTKEVVVENKNENAKEIAVENKNKENDILIKEETKAV